MSRNKILESFLKAGSVSTDSRSIQPGQIFFALKGNTFNGNEYALEVLGRGAALAVVDEDFGYNHSGVIQVTDTLAALQQLAADYRDLFDIPVFAITGSNGKTTCKELIRDVIAKKYKVTATKGNLNNHIGIPLTILSIPRDCEFAVIEMGANHCNEIAGYCSYTRPNFGYITNIGLAHLDGFGGAEGVLRGKTELFDFLSANGGVLFGDIGQPKMVKALAGREFISTAIDDIGISICAEEPFISYQLNECDLVIATKFAGNYNLMNIAAAIGIGRYFGVAESDIHDAISAYVPGSNRSELNVTDTNKVIMDAYNANPTSMEHALRSFARNKAHDKWAILGDMRELGSESVDLHQKIADLVEVLNIQAIFVGENFSKCQISSACLCFEKMEDLSEHLIQHPIRNATVLLKGSRGMRMESIAQFL